MSFNLKSLLVDGLIIKSILNKTDESTLDASFVTNPAFKAEVEKAAVLKNLQLHKNIPSIIQGIKQSQDNNPPVEVQIQITNVGLGKEQIHNGFIETTDIKSEPE